MNKKWMHHLCRNFFLYSFPEKLLHVSLFCAYSSNCHTQDRKIFRLMLFKICRHVFMLEEYIIREDEKFYVHHKLGLIKKSVGQIWKFWSTSHDLVRITVLKCYCWCVVVCCSNNNDNGCKEEKKEDEMRCEMRSRWVVCCPYLNDLLANEPSRLL